MKLSKAIKILKKHQQWRLGAEQSKPTEPRKLTEAINLVLYALELSKTYIKYTEIGDYQKLREL